MATNVYTSNGWDLIAAASQDGLNAQLSKIPAKVVKTDMTIELLGLDVSCHLDITIGPPQLNVKDGSGRQMDIRFPLSGVIVFNGKKNIPIPKDEVVVVTTQLLQVEAKIAPKPEKNQTYYDLIVDFESEDVLVNIKLDIPAAELAGVISVLTQVIKQKIGTFVPEDHPLASFALTKEDAAKWKPLIPRLADFSFVQNHEKPGRSNLLVLMQSISEKKGNIYFSAPVLPANEDFMVLVSNEIFLKYCVMPPLIAQIQKEAKDKNSVPSKIGMKALTDPFMFQVVKLKDIDLKKDHDPWISDINVAIDTKMQALCLYLKAKADVTGLKIRVEAWDRSWQKLIMDTKGELHLNQIKEEKNSSTHMDWWKWLLAVLTGPIGLLIIGIVYSVVEKNEPDLGGTFKDVGKTLVRWPNQKEVLLKDVTLPNHVVMHLEVHFFE